VAALCAGTVEGLALGAQEIVFHPGELRGGTFAFDVGTAGSVPLVLQALLPAMVASGHRFEVGLTGGTDIRAAPPLDYVDHVLFPLLRRLGARVTLQCARRGYYPRGGGLIEVCVDPCTLTAHAFEAPGRVLVVRGVAHASRLPMHVPERMRVSAIACLADCTAADVEIRTLAHTDSLGAGGAIVTWAETEHTVIGAGRIAQRGVPAEVLGSEAGSELVADLGDGATLDMHAADQMLVYLALSGGGAFLTRAITSHAETTMWLIEQLLPVRFTCSARGALTHVAIADAAPR
jgi:RNA 3'-terminal phosphate cyclase (ATP)